MTSQLSFIGEDGTHVCLGTGKRAASKLFDTNFWDPNPSIFWNDARRKAKSRCRYTWEYRIPYYCMYVARQRNMKHDSSKLLRTTTYYMTYINIIITHHYINNMEARCRSLSTSTVRTYSILCTKCRAATYWSLEYFEQEEPLEEDKNGITKWEGSRRFRP